MAFEMEGSSPNRHHAGPDKLEGGLGRRAQDFRMPETVDFAIHNSVFTVPFRPFERALPSLLDKIYATLDSQGRQMLPVKLDSDVWIGDFETLQKYISLPEIKTESFLLLEWVSILQLSTRWSLTDIRNTAIDHMTRMGLKPATKIMLGLSHNIPEWVASGQAELVERPTSLTEDEIMMMGRETATRILRLRDGLKADEECVVVDLSDSDDSDCGSSIEEITARDAESIHSTLPGANMFSEEPLTVQEGEKGSVIVCDEEELFHSLALPIAESSALPTACPASVDSSENADASHTYAPTPSSLSQNSLTTKVSMEDITLSTTDQLECPAPVVPVLLSPTSSTPPPTASDPPSPLSLEDAEATLTQALVEETGAQAALDIVTEDLALTAQIQNTLSNLTQRAEAQGGPVRRALFGVVRRLAVAVVDVQDVERERGKAEDARRAAQALVRSACEKVKAIQAVVDGLRARLDATALQNVENNTRGIPDIPDIPDVPPPVPDVPDIPTTVPDVPDVPTPVPDIPDIPTPVPDVPPPVPDVPDIPLTVPTIPPHQPPAPSAVKSLLAEFRERVAQRKQEEMDWLAAEQFNRRVAARLAQTTARRRQASPPASNPSPTLPTNAAQREAIATWGEAKVAAEMAYAEQDRALAELDVATEDLVSAQLQVSTAENILQRSGEASSSAVAKVRQDILRRQALRDLETGRSDMERAEVKQREAKEKMRVASEIASECAAGVEATREWLNVLEPNGSREDAVRRLSGL